MRLLVTGANGFVGSSVALRARAAGHHVLGVARDGSAGVRADVSTELVHAVVDRFRPDAVLHAAGSADVARSLDEPLGDYGDSLDTFVRVLESIRRSRARPLVLFPSSAAVYGEPAVLPVAEDAPPAPVSPYGFHKLACETLARSYATCFGVPVAVFRLFSLLGPRQRRLLVYELFEQAVGPRPCIEVRGTGEETRDYLYIDDAADAMLAVAAGAPPGFGVWNLGSGAATPVREVARLVRDAVGARKEIHCLGEAQPGQPLHWQADVSRVRARHPAAPIPLARAVQLCVDAWRRADA
jgi:UDP-glucose 4-epimerase